MDSVARMVEVDEASRGLGIHVVETGNGTATTTTPVRPDMLNGHGIADGAFVFAVADTAFACAGNSHGPAMGAAAVDVTSVVPAHARDLLHARAVERTLPRNQAGPPGRNGITSRSARTTS